MTALSLPSNPVNGQKHIHADKVYIYNSSKGYWKVAGSEAVSDAAASLFTSQDTVHSANIATLYTLVEDSQGVTSYANTSLLPLSGVSAGSMAFVSGSNRLYISNGTGWYSISLVNTNPNITSVQDASSGNSPFTLATDGTATVITITANDPEQVPLTYNYSVTSGSLTNGGGTTATVTQSDNVFTVTPSTTEAYAGTFELTFTASDGVNTSTNANSFTLSFITYVTNSNYTTLLSTPTAPNSTVYRYFKFLPQEMRSATPDAMQYSEFELTDGTSYYSPDSASQLYRADDTDGDDYVASQRVAASIDGSTGTKLFNGSWATKYYLYDMGSSFNTVLTGWRYKTANDVDGRDPVSWTLFGSTNNTDWVILDQRTQETITTSRQTATQDFLFNSSNQIIQNHANSNHPFAVVGDAHAGTFSPYRSGGYSTYFDGTGDYIDTNSSINLSSGGCIEGWVYITSATNYAFFIASAEGTPGYPRWYVGHSNATDWRCSPGDSTDNNITSYDLITNQWNHFVLSNDGSTSRLFANGVLIFTKSVTPVNENLTFTLSKYGSSAQYLMTGNLFDVRVNTSIPTEYQTSSTTVGSSIFTPPTEPLSSSGAALHICHLPYLADGSSNNYTLTPTGDVSTKPFSPYDYLEYSATDHGGSVYFDGTTDYIEHQGGFTLPTGTNANWTIECWVNLDQVNLNQGILRVSSTAANGNNDDIYFSEQGGYINTACKGGAIASTTTNYKMYANTWHHIAMVKNSGTVYLYNNGVYCGSVSDSNNYSGNYYVYGGLYYSSSYCIAGYLSDFKISNSAIYTTGTSNFTPPTAPLSSSGAALHIKGTEASIIDKSQGANLKLVGNTTGSTAQAKFASSKSMYFDAVGDYISIPVDEAYGFGTGDWTIETWLYCTKTGGFNAIFDTRVGTGTQTGNFGIGMYNTGRVQLFSGGIFYYPTDTLSFNTWQHFAVVKNSGTTTMYFNGTAASSTYSDSRDYGSSQPVQIGKDDTTSNYFGGYMQDFRISKGLARYTSNFTPPTASLEG
jgi:hypothetical protein